MPVEILTWVNKGMIQKQVQRQSIWDRQGNGTQPRWRVWHSMWLCGDSFFLSAGEVGDWANHFSLDQLQLFEEDYERQMKTTSIPFKTKTKVDF